MAEKNPPPNKSQSDHISNSDTSDEETNQHLRTSVEEIHYGTIRGSAQATQAALTHTIAQCNPPVERGLPRQPIIRQLPQDKSEDKTTQTKHDKHSK